MGIKQIPIKKFLKFLKSQGCQYIRTEASHDIWDRPKNPLPRPITVRMKHKDIPLLHIHTSLQNLGVSKSEFEKYLREN